MSLTNLCNYTKEESDFKWLTSDNASLTISVALLSYLILA